MSLILLNVYLYTAVFAQKERVHAERIGMLKWTLYFPCHFLIFLMYIVLDPNLFECSIQNSRYVVDTYDKSLFHLSSPEVSDHSLYSICFCRKLCFNYLQTWHMSAKPKWCLLSWSKGRSKSKRLSRWTSKVPK